MDEVHNKSKKILKNFIDKDLSELLNEMETNTEPYDSKQIYEENLLLKIQHEKSLVRLNQNLEKLINVLEKSKNCKNDS